MSFFPFILCFLSVFNYYMRNVCVLTVDNFRLLNDSSDIRLRVSKLLGTKFSINVNFYNCGEIVLK